MIFIPRFEFKEFKFLNDLKFTEHYKEIFDFSVDLTNPKVKSYIEDRQKICTFCGAREFDGAKFKKDAHVIPAFFNDPKLFSNEECDECNEKFGNKYEDYLSKMLNPLLISGQILPRKGSTRKAKDRKSEISFNKDIGYDIKTQDHFTVDTKEGTLTISIPQEAFKPNDALKSLLHTFWLVINDEIRNVNQWIRNIIIRGQDEAPTAIYFGSNFTDDKKIVLQIFQRKSGEDRICKFVLKLQFGIYLLYYGIYKNSFTPIIIQPFNIDESISMSPTMKLFDCINIKKVSAVQQNVPYSFTQYSSSKDGVIKSIEKLDEYLVALVINKRVIINKTMIQFYKDHKIIIEGLDFTAKIIFTPDANNKKAELKFTSLFEGKSIINVKETIDFIEGINKSNKFSIFSFQNNFKQSIPTQDIPISDELIKLIKSIYTIAIEFNKNIIFHPINDISEIKIIDWIYNIIKKKEVTIGNCLKISNKANKSVFDDFIKYVSDNENIQFDYPQDEINIMGTKISLSEVICIKCKTITNVEIEEDVIIIDADEISIGLKNDLKE